MKHVKHIILHLVFNLCSNILTLLAVDLVILSHIHWGVHAVHVGVHLVPAGVHLATNFWCVPSINIVILHLLTVKLIHTAKHLAANLVLKLVLPHHVVPLMLLLELV